MGVKNLVRWALQRAGYDVLQRGGKRVLLQLPPDLPLAVQQTYQAVAPFTMTSWERVISLIEATEYVARNRIPGAFVECGVWRGGSMMAVALTLLRSGDQTRDLYLYDTFAGMSEPTARDVRATDGTAASVLLKENPRDEGLWCHAGLSEVRARLLATGYPETRLHFVQGKVEETIPGTIPAEIALLRLDTDWYESTRHELIHLFPRLQRGGVLILDDYGWWQGAREAVDEYLAQQHVPILLSRMDREGRIGVKI